MNIDWQDLVLTVIISCIIGGFVAAFIVDYKIDQDFKKRALCLGMLQYNNETGKLEVSDKKDYGKMDYMYLLKSIREDGLHVFIHGCNK